MSTSTSGFAGPARKGPISGTPPLITSFAEFVRIFGGLEDLDLVGTDETTNYLAHSVRAYFNEGGSRLYVARVFAGTASASTAKADVIPNGDPQQRVRLTARFPGSGGNGTITVKEFLAPATVGSMQRAPAGSMIRLNQTAATKASLTGALAPPFNVPNNATLVLTIDGSDVTLTFKGKNAETIGTNELDPTTTFIEANKTLTVTIGGVVQTITFPTTGPLTPGEIVDFLNRQLRGGYARLTSGTELPLGRLVLGTDAKGLDATIQVTTSTPLKLVAQTVTNSGDTANNTVGDLGAVDLADINALLGSNGEASVENNKLVISVNDPGNTHTLVLDSVSTPSLGFDTPTAQLGAAGTPGVTRWVKQADGTWSNGSTTLSLPTDEASKFLQLPGESSFVTLNVITQDGDGQERQYDGLALHPDHPRYIGSVLSPNPSTLTEQMERLYAVEIGENVTAFALRTALAAGTFELEGGTDGNEPGEGGNSGYTNAMERLGGVEDISIIAAPGSSAYSSAQAVRLALISAAEARRAYRIAVLDTPLKIGSAQFGPQDAAALRAKHDSTKAALYFPWVMVANPLARPDSADIPREIALPPSAFICGIYARSDIERGVFKAPANEVVRSALRFQQEINFAQQETLNPIGVNCLRFFPGRGYRVWGARTISSDPEWKYVNVRRYFNFLERSVDNGTQWAVFEPNGERLWANINETISSFLENQWRSGAFLGTTPEQAFFVRCDRTTMDQNDIDNGRLVCLIGVAVVKPAEFVIFRVGQKTADARS